MSRKIIFLVSSMNSGGAERVAANLVNAWLERGDDVTLVITYSGQGECFYQLAEKVELIYLADYSGVVGRGVMAYWIRFRALRRLIRQKNPNVVLSFLSNVNIAAILCSLGLGCQVIVSERSYPPKRAIGRMSAWLRRLTYPLAYQVVLLSSEGLVWLHECIPRAKGVVIPNPVTFPLANAEPRLNPDTYIKSHRKLLLAVGRLDEGKQFDRLLAAFSVLANRYPLWDLIILGEGVECGPLLADVERLGLVDRALLPGRVGNLGDWYTRADLYVMSSRFEGFPNTLAEAMAHGCAAISYDCDTGPRDIIHHEIDGLLVRPVGDVQALSQALDRLMGNDAERVRMAQLATKVRDRYSMSSILSKWDALFDVVENKGGR
jgi:glycosyltransferase involved in cell wall biosynthesis